MNRNNIKQALHLSKLIPATSLAHTTDIYTTLLKCSRAISRLDVRLCNGNISIAQYDKRLDLLKKRITETIKGTPLYTYHQTDPRGVALYVSDVPVDSENYFNAIAIY